MSRTAQILLIACGTLIGASSAQATDLYYSQWDWQGAIYRMDLDTMESELVTSDAVYPLRLCADPVGEKIYWIESYVGYICRANLDGSHVEIVVEGCVGEG